ncbi:RES family NAD+ phosphorylase [Falsiroseomonas oryzae]|uniref:RES family NAD+ phosphorylase n=1 Tax=Falsiroseomonas oryzae TaxID=2766473 RepID=UPI0022EA8B3F|nr:RES family NAD+ phosphorylase [Roseomonas sp. MO-31]
MALIGWQVCREHQADLTGRQAEDGERWNGPGRLVAYLSEHPALAVLEMRAHLDKPYDEIVHDHVLMRVSLPDDVEEVAAMPQDPRAHGDAWLREGRSAVLRVPSIVVQEGRNLLLNVRHPRAAEARLLACTPFRFDRRLWGG